MNTALLNKPQSTPNFAQVSDLWVCDGQTSTKTQKANASEFEASARALEGKVGEKRRQIQKAENSGYKNSKNQAPPTQLCFAILASIAPGFPAEHKRMRETRTPQLYLPRSPKKISRAMYERYTAAR